MIDTFSVWDTCMPQPWCIAKCLQDIPEFKECYRYIGNGKWEYKSGNTWMLDRKQAHLTQFLQVFVSGQVMQRGIYWQKLNYHDEHDKEMNVVRLLSIASMMNNTKTIKDIIRDAKEFAEHS